MTKIAFVTLVRDDAVSSIERKTYVEEVRGFVDITWAPKHVVFNMENGFIIAYNADHVCKIFSHEDED